MDAIAKSPSGRGRRVLRRIALVVFGLAILFALIVAAGGLWLRSQMLEDLPRVDGGVQVAGLTAPVTVERDALGIPTIRGANRRDVAFATGFVHAQDRFFQMDVLRRRSAGELAALLGAHALDSDRSLRIHRFRALAQRVVAKSAPDIQDLLQAYTQGVNAGLSGLAEKPFEYLLLRVEPEPWKPEDSVLVLLSMFVELGDVNGAVEADLSLMHDLLPEPVYQFLVPVGTEWDAPVLGGPLNAPPVPGPGVLDVHLRRVAAAAPVESEPALRGAATPGSNSWVVAGSHTADGGALLANELHLALGVPNIWYRLSLSWPDESAPGRARTITGATLPGAPFLVVGSNGAVAWGVTNSVVDTSDLVLLDLDPRRPNVYRTPQGPRFLDRHDEVLHVRGGDDVALPVEWSVWGPLIANDHQRRRRAVRAVVDDVDAVDFEILRLETAQNVGEAVAWARRSGVPSLSFVAADAAGHIAWTLMGRIPRRVGFDGSLAGSWADGQRRWDGLLPPEEVPALVDPVSGRLWTANNRVVDEPQLAKLPGHYVLGARARQIRDDLFALDRATVDDLRKVQLDDRALFLQRWRDLLLRTLTPEAVAGHPHRSEIRTLAENWGGRAAVDSAGYRMVRTFRLLLARDVFNALLADCTKADPDFVYTDRVDQFEGPLWRLVTERPMHLLDARYKTWDEQLLAAVDAVADTYASQGPLAERTWGERNMTTIRHLLSPALPGAGRWLDMPAQPLPGDEYMPRVQDQDYGATLRMVVAPGREAQSIFHMPGGESGNPLSPHYGDAHAAWAEGAATPFLPGPPKHRLTLSPAR